MKQLISCISIALFSFAHLSAQDNTQVQTLFGNGQGNFGGFLMTGVKAGEVNGESGLFVGGVISAVFSSSLNIGFAGYGLATEIDADTYSSNNTLYKLDMGYGGLVLEPVIGNRSLLHITLPVLLGVGGTGLRVKSYRDNSWEDDFDREFEYDESDLFLVIEPGLNIEVNLLKHIRLNLGASYRQVHDSNLEGISDEELSGFAANVGLKFGWF